MPDDLNLLIRGEVTGSIVAPRSIRARRVPSQSEDALSNDRLFLRGKLAFEAYIRSKRRDSGAFLGSGEHVALFTKLACRRSDYRLAIDIDLLARGNRPLNIFFTHEVVNAPVARSIR